MKEMLHKKTIKILTICTGNICRSPMAEGILRAAFQDNPSIEVSSAGTHAIEGTPASEFAILVSGEKRINVKDHRARFLERLFVSSSDMILCMEPFHAEHALSLDSSAYDKVYNLADFSGTADKMRKIADPYGCSLREYRLCFDEIDRCIHNFIALCRGKNLLPK